MIPWPLTVALDYRVGERAKREVRAPFDFVVEDREATKELTQRALSQVKPVFILNTGWLSEASDKISTLFSELRLAYENSSPRKDLKRFREVLAIDIPINQVKTFRRYKYDPWVEDMVISLLFKLGDYWILSPHTPLNTGLLRHGFVIKDVQLSKEFEVDDISGVYTMKDVDVLIKRNVARKVPYRMASLRRAITVLLSKMVRPNLFYDSKTTQILRAEAIKSISSVRRRVKKGDIIVKEGERITPSMLVELDVVKEKGVKSPVLFVLGFFLFSVVALFLIVLCWFRLYKGRAEPLVSFRILLFTLVPFVGLMRLGGYVFERLPWALPWLKGVFICSALPLAFPGIFIAFLFHFIPALVVTVGAVVWLILMPEVPTFLAVELLLASVAGAYAMKKGGGERSLVKGVVMAALVLLLLVLGRSFSEGSSLDVAFMDVATVPVSTLFSLFLVLAAVPLTEMLFGVVTDLGLLTYINLDHPLMQELLEEAPGTYNHSVDVATLAEAAAQAVDANPLLAKAGAYYHDIGKLKNPEYFIENVEGDSRHDKLSPSMSRLILVSHVKDGVELARKYKLPKAIIDIIQQHHGTSLIYYFYHKAMEKTPKSREVEEGDFRYPGPKPSSKEAAIVMMADVVEAAARSLDDPSPTRIRHLVRDMITGIFLDGQLEGCELTLRDIYEVMEVLSKVLVGIYHRRIEYPHREKEKSGWDNRLGSSESEGA